MLAGAVLYLALLTPSPPALAQDETGSGADVQALSQDPAQWVMATPKNYASTRFNGLDQIKTENVDRLQLAWTFSVGVSLRSGCRERVLSPRHTLKITLVQPVRDLSTDLIALTGGIECRVRREDARVRPSLCRLDTSPQLSHLVLDPPEILHRAG